MERNEIYREKNSIEEFGIDDSNSINNVLFDILLQLEDFPRGDDLENTILGMFNDAYYICTLVLLEKRPYFNIRKYKEIASRREKYAIYNHVRVIIVISMVSVYLNSLDMITDDMERTVNVIRSEFTGCDGNIYEKIATALDGRNCVIKADTFYPLQLPVNYAQSNFWETYRVFPHEMTGFVNSKMDEWLLGHLAKGDSIDQVLGGGDAGKKRGSDLARLYKEGVIGGKKVDKEKHIKELEKELENYKERNNCIQSELDLIRGANASVVSKYNKRIEELQHELQAYKEKNKHIDAGPASALFLAIAQMTDAETLNKEKLALAVSKIFGWKVSDDGKGHVRNRMCGKGDDGITSKHIEYIANIVQDALPKLAAKIRKL